MTVDRIKYGKSFQIGLSIWEKIDIEATVDDSKDDIEEAYNLLKRTVEGFHRASNPSLYPKGNEAIVESFSNTLPETNLQKEKTEIAIDNCTSLEDLKKLEGDAIKYLLVKQYLEKKKELA